MHTSAILRSDHFHSVDDSGAPIALTGDLRREDRLGIISPRYEDALLGASGVILAFVTAFYDLQRAGQAETGEPFFIYPDYYAFFLGESDAVHGQTETAALGQGVSDAYGWLDIWPEEKWIVSQDSGALWAQVASHNITRLLVPSDPGNALGAVPAAVRLAAKDVYRYLPGGESAVGPDHIRVELATAPSAIIGQALAYLPSNSPARSAPPPTAHCLVRW